MFFLLFFVGFSEAFLVAKWRKNQLKIRVARRLIFSRFVDGFVVDFGLVFGALLALKSGAECIENLSIIFNHFLMFF